jgi:hypothetical protein
MLMQRIKLLWRGCIILCLVLPLLACQAGLSSPDKAEGVSAPGAQWIGEYVDAEGKTGIRGHVYIKEEEGALSGGYVNIYPDAVTNLLGPSQFMSIPTDAGGNFELDVPPGIYYVVARKRLSGQPTGPLSPGDYYSDHQRLVAKVVAGKMVVVDLPVVVMKAPMFFNSRQTDKETTTGIKGVLVDQFGKPVRGGFAMAYVNQEMKRLPDYISSLSDERGNFTLYLPEGGTYYLGARIQAWDMPAHGEPYGIYGGETPTPVKLATNSFVEQIRIQLTPFQGAYKPGKSQKPF